MIDYPMNYFRDFVYWFYMQHQISMSIVSVMLFLSVAISLLILIKKWSE